MRLSCYDERRTPQTFAVTGCHSAQYAAQYATSWTQDSSPTFPGATPLSKSVRGGVRHLPRRWGAPLDQHVEPVRGVDRCAYRRHPPRRPSTTRPNARLFVLASGPSGAPHQFCRMSPNIPGTALPTPIPHARSLPPPPRTRRLGGGAASGAAADTCGHSDLRRGGVQLKGVPPHQHRQRRDGLEQRELVTCTSRSRDHALMGRTLSEGCLGVQSQEQLTGAWIPPIPVLAAPQQQGDI